MEVAPRVKAKATEAKFEEDRNLLSLRLKSEELRECLWDEFTPTLFNPSVLYLRCKFCGDRVQSHRPIRWMKEVGAFRLTVPPRLPCSKRDDSSKIALNES